MFQVCIPQSEVRCPQSGNAIFLTRLYFATQIVKHSFHRLFSRNVATGSLHPYITTVLSSYLMMNKKTVRRTFYEPPKRSP